MSAAGARPGDATRAVTEAGTRGATDAETSASVDAASPARTHAAAPDPKAAPSTVRPLRLDGAALHRSVGDPSMAAVGFLNEIRARHPQAVSFAPGAPQLARLSARDLPRYAERWLRYQRETHGIGREWAHALLLDYGPSRGLINDLVARALRLDHGLAAGVRDVVVTVGAQEGLLLTLRALCRDERDLVAVVTPAYVGALGAARMLDIGLVPVPEREGEGVDLDRLAQVCRRARAQGRRIRALYTAPDFANPSGTLLDLPQRLRLLAAADELDLVVVEDTTYGFTAPDGAALPPLKALDTTGRVVMVGTFAKIGLPGARVGFVLADQPVRLADGSEGRLADALAALKTMTTVNTPPMSQAVIGGMLLEHGGSLLALGRASAEPYRRNLAALLAALDRRRAELPAAVSWNRPAGGFFVTMRLPVAADAALLEVSAAEYGVLWTPMADFHLDASGRDQLRLSCSSLDPEQIEEGAGRLTAFLRSLPTSKAKGGTRCAY